MPRRQLTTEAQSFIATAVRPGDHVIDATLGNGHDCLFLARLVGETGRVSGFDIQPDALISSRHLLQQAGLDNRVEMYCQGHQHLTNRLPEQAHSIRAIMFNLGYLPGGDKSHITQTSTTLQALEASRVLLSAGGRLSLIAYLAHPGGTEENDAIEDWFQQLSGTDWQWQLEVPEAARQPPRLYCLERLEI